MPADATDERLLTGWGRTAPSRAAVWSPRRTDEVASRLAGFGGRGVIARGLGRSYGDAAQNAGGTVVLATGLDRILELDVTKGELTVEAGASLDTLMRALVPLGWFPTVVPGTRHVTIGGAIASDIHGKYRGGSFCDTVTRLRLVTPDRGVLTVGRDSHPEVFWATAGAMGLTGVITEATMRLREIETAHVRVDTERATDVDDCMGRMIETDDRYEYSVAWIDCLASGRDLGRSVLTRANHATLDGLPPELARRAREFAPRAWLSAPPWMPNGLLNGLTVRAFNTAWFRRAPRARREELQTITQFFHPLDGVLGWNRVYGSQGFVQYQLLVPNGAEDVVRRVLERLAAARSPSFLAVLKRFEHGNDGMLSFPAPGWTLALDVPAGRHGLAGLLDGLDRLVVDAGGRVYLTKDSRLAPALLPEMYPRLTAWREVRDGLDARGVMRSDMARRLDLTGRRIREGSNA